MFFQLLEETYDDKKRNDIGFKLKTQVRFLASIQAVYTLIIYTFWWKKSDQSSTKYTSVLRFIFGHKLIFFKEKIAAIVETWSEISQRLDRIMYSNSRLYQMRFWRLFLQ